MSKYDITGAEFAAVTGLADPSSFTETGHPVETLTWYAAIYFCNILSMKEGLTPVYTINGQTNPTNWSATAILTITTDAPAYDTVTANWSANGYRLPTEMEYMWAAMGATSDALSGDIVGGVNTGGYLKGYAGSTEAGSAQVNINSYALTENSTPAPTSTEAVGLLLPNELGLYDMSGNVFQWCWGAYDGVSGYPGGVLTDPTGYSGQAWASGFNRIIRGECWEGPTYYVTFDAPRCGDLPYSLNGGIGFRVVRP